MTNNILKLKASRWRALLGALVLICAASAVSMAQTPGGTVISNTATSSYTDGTATTYNTTSNTVSVTVSNVAGLTITPDAGAHAGVVRSQTNVDFFFTVTNTGNFTNQVVFKATGASIIRTGSATVTAAFIDLNQNGAFDTGETDILANGADVTSADVLQNETLKVIVRVDIAPTAVGGSTINIQLGDAAVSAPWDNEALVASASDVRTAIAGADLVQKEARGDISATVDTSGSVLLGPSGAPAAFGTDTNDDYTNLSVNTGIATVAPGGTTTASGTVVFTNTVQNTGNSSDTFTFTVPVLTIPAGFTVEVSVNGGTNYFDPAVTPQTLTVAAGASADIMVRVVAPLGKLVLTGFPTTVLATSLNTPGSSNATIDRLYTGFLQLTKSQSGAGVTAPVPGSTIVYLVAYDNVTSSGGTGNAILTASGIVLVDPMPANTDFNVGSATSSPASGITVVPSYSNDGGTTWTYTPTSLAGGAPAGFDRTVTHVKFTLTGPMDPAAAAGNSGFTVRIR